jgi:predicted signal transduction protein with EAL and GGDEF domain
MTIKAALAVVTVICSIAAAGLWWYASRVKVSPERAAVIEKEEFARTGRHRPVALSFTGDADLQYTLEAQSRWNSYAAAAGLAAASQAAYVAVSEFSGPSA